MCHPISAYYVPLSYVKTMPYVLQIFFFIFHLDRVFENMIALIKPIIAVHLLKITHNDDNSTYLDLLPYFSNSLIKETRQIVLCIIPASPIVFFGCVLFRI